MTAMPELTDDRLAELVARTRGRPSADAPARDEGPDAPEAAPPASPAAPAPVPFATRAKHAAKRRLARARPVVDRVTRRLVREVFIRSPELTDRIVAGIAERSKLWALDAASAELRGDIGLLRAEVEALRRQLSWFAPVADDVHALTVNGELVKAQLLSVHDEIEALGWAIAPGAGIGAAGERLAELRLRLNELDRRVRLLADAALRSYRTGAPSESVVGAEPAGTSESSTGASSAPARAAADVASFDYSGFEHRFRGDPEQVAATLFDRYGELLAANQPVLDVGCGRGELLARLAGAGVEARGVELDAAMADAALARGLDVTHGDALAYLRSLPAASLGAIVSIHVVEHLPLDALLELFALASDRLRPGGVLVFETPNPASLIVLGNSYVMDPTHVRPLHPSLLTFLAEGAGFDDVRLRFYEPATAYHLPRLTLDADAPQWVRDLDEGIARLNDVLFGAQEYALVARTPAR